MFQAKPLRELGSAASRNGGSIHRAYVMYPPFLRWPYRGNKQNWIEQEPPRAFWSRRYNYIVVRRLLVSAAGPGLTRVNTDPSSARLLLNRTRNCAKDWICGSQWRLQPAQPRVSAQMAAVKYRLRVRENVETAWCLENYQDVGNCDSLRRFGGGDRTPFSFLLSYER